MKQYHNEKTEESREEGSVSRKNGNEEGAFQKPAGDTLK